LFKSVGERKRGIKNYGGNWYKREKQCVDSNANKEEDNKEQERGRGEQWGLEEEPRGVKSPQKNLPQGEQTILNYVT